MMIDWFCLDCRVTMKWQDRAFWKCPVCGVEVWPPEPEEIERRKRDDVAGMVSRSWVPGAEAKGGGGPSGKKHKKPMKHSSFDYRFRPD